MSQQNPDLAVREIEHSLLKVSPELHFSFQEFEGRRCCVIEDTMTGKFFRVGLSEYHFIRMLDGKTTVGKALAQMAAKFPQEALTPSEVAGVVRWLLHNQLAVSEVTTPSEQLASRRSQQPTGMAWKSWSNLLFFKIPFGNPDRFFSRIEPWLHSLLGWPFFILWSTTVLIALFQLVWDWDRFVVSSAGVLAPHNWLWLLIGWVLLKIFHEFSHGISCKYWGGQIPEMGAFFIIFAPLGYVDVTSSWRFSSKWHRIMVGAAGMYAELFLAAISVLIWGQTEKGVVNTLAYNTLLMGSVVTVFFNANPLMRFDGYYLLSDYLGIANLYSRGTHSIQNLARHFLIGIEQAPVPDLKDPVDIFVACYGVASFFWRLFIMITLLIAASLLFEGGGFVLALIAGFWWMIPPLLKLAHYLKEGNKQEKPNPRVYGMRLGLLSLGLIAFAFLPFYETLTAPAITDFAQAAIVRAECPGFVEKVYVADGTPVEKGDLLIKLRNEDEQAKLRRLESQYRQGEIRARMEQKEKDPTGFLIEMRKLESLEKQAKEQRDFVNSLELRAPQSGQVVGRRFHSLPGTFLPTGEEVLLVGQFHKREVEIAIAEQDVDEFRAHLDRKIWVNLPGRSKVFEAILEKVEPLGSQEIPHFGLAAVGGGPLIVEPRKNKAPSQSQSELENYVLIEPYFVAKAKMITPDEENIASGELAYIKFTSHQAKPLWKVMYGFFDRFFLYLMRRAQ